VLDIEGALEVEPGLFQQADGTITLPARAAEIHNESAQLHQDQKTGTLARKEAGGNIGLGNSSIAISPLGAAVNWFETGNWLSWKFKVYTPDRYTVRIVTTGLHHSNPWKGGHRVRVNVAGSEVRGTLAEDEQIVNVSTRYYSQAASRCGDITIDRSGTYTLALRAEEILRNGDVGLAVMAGELVEIVAGSSRPPGANL